MKKPFKQALQDLIDVYLEEDGADHDQIRDDMKETFETLDQIVGEKE